MSRNSVLQSTKTIPELLEKPVVAANVSKLFALMGSHHNTFESVSSLVDPIVLAREVGSYVLGFTLTVPQADELGRGRENVVMKNGAIEVHFSTRVIVRICKLEDRKLTMDCAPNDLRVNVNKIFYKGQLQSPIDITASIIVNPGIANAVTLNLSSVQGIFVVAILLVKALSPTAIVKILTEKRTRSAEITVEKFGNRPGEDVAVTSTEVSLVCPLSRKRCEVPALGEGCSHIVCFDLNHFLKLNSLSKRWSCPICNKKILPSQLVVDGFFKKVLDFLVASKSDCSTIMVTNQGCWFPKQEPTEAEAQTTASIE